MSIDINKHYEKVSESLNGIGNGMCLAKWTQVTLQLHTGHNHSCHHPSLHKIPEIEIKNNPSALHNTRFKKEKRREMLNGGRPSECEYCWKIEDNSDRYSDRVFKSSEPWSWEHYNEIKDLNWRADFNPKYVEVAFSNTCNFKCMYCGPQFSSSWVEELKKYGPYENGFNHFNEETTPYLNSEHNPYVDAFWEWWPELYRDLHTFRITGGEPLLSKDTWGVLDYILEQKEPNRNLNLAINTNLGVPDKLIDNLIEKCKRILGEGRIRELVIFTSCDAHGKQAEYLRNGMDYNRFMNNVNKILTELPQVTIDFMVTYNALSVFSFDKFILDVLELKRVHQNEQRCWIQPAIFDTSYLRYPNFMSIQILPHQMKHNILEQSKLALFNATLMYDHTHMGCSDMEIQKLKRTYDWAISPIDDNELFKQRKTFSHYIKQIDQRRGTDFVKTFPELEDFYKTHLI
jgi:organic radical activating enzyme